VFVSSPLFGPTEGRPRSRKKIFPLIWSILDSPVDRVLPESSASHPLSRGILMSRREVLPPFRGVRFLEI